jgi:hypothetical protein
MSTPIDVDVTIVDGVASYKSSDSDQVQPDGTITIESGEEAVITFYPASGQTWQFQTPTGVTIDPTGGDVGITSQSAASVQLTDNNPKGAPSTYEYTLYTTVGVLDPRLINKGT